MSNKTSNNMIKNFDYNSFTTVINDIEGSTILSIIAEFKLTFSHKILGGGTRLFFTPCTKEGVIEKLVTEEIQSECSEMGLSNMNWFFEGICKIKQKKNPNGYYDLTITRTDFKNNEFLIIKNCTSNFIKLAKRHIRVNDDNSSWVRDYNAYELKALFNTL